MTTLHLDEPVAICAPDHGFWIGRLCHDLNLAQPPARVKIEWYDELQNNRGMYSASVRSMYTACLRGFVWET